MQERAGRIAALAGRVADAAFQDVLGRIQPGRQADEAAGFGPQFMHRTGHGIGMRGYEEPYLIEGNAQPLEPSHCFSVEPGIYLPGRFGVRIENCVVCTEGGHRSLNVEPPDRVLEVG